MTELTIECDQVRIDTETGTNKVSVELTNVDIESILANLHYSDIVTKVDNLQELFNCIVTYDPSVIKDK